MFDSYAKRFEPCLVRVDPHMATCMDEVLADYHCPPGRRHRASVAPGRMKAICAKGYHCGCYGYVENGVSNACCGCGARAPLRTRTGKFRRLTPAEARALRATNAPRGTLAPQPT